MTYDIKCLPLIYLGRQGENLARTVEIDVGAMLEAYPGASIGLVFQRAGETELYIGATTLSDTVLSWPISAAVTANAGRGKIEVRAMLGDVLAKSVTAPTQVDVSLSGAGSTPPDPEEDWIDDVLQAASEAKQSASSAADSAQKAEQAVEDAKDAAAAVEAAKTEAVQAVQEAGQAAQGAVSAEGAEAVQTIGQAASGAVEQVQQAGDAQVQAIEQAGDEKIQEIDTANAHSPQINADTGKWQTWDSASGTYVDTETNAEGPQGPAGSDGKDGAPGAQGPAGENGATFTPSVSASGDLSWTNDKSLPNPDTVNIRGPQGPTGPAGADGAQGPQGLAGTAATIQVGTVTASAPGSTPQVTNSGTASAAVFDFIIPCGAQGPSGADGQDAPQIDDTQASQDHPWSGAKIADELSKLPQESLECTIETYYALRRTGKVYQTKLWKYAANPTSTGEKLLDNAGLVFEPSTDTVEGQDDYADIPLFQWVNCNYIRDDDGAARPIAIEGMDSYKTSGAVDVGAMQMSFWWNWDATPEDHVLVTVSDTPHPELGLVPWPECVKADGTVLPWCIGSSYISGEASDGLLRSQPGLLPALFQSHNGMITNYQLKGPGYWGAGAVRNLWQILWIAIKGATKNSQSLFYGCTNYNYQYAVAAATTGQTYVTLTEQQAENLIAGSCVCIGTGPEEGANLDRGQAYMRDIVSLARISKIEGANVFLDHDAFDVPAGAYLSTMPWISGTTDAVRGHHDGSATSNAGGKYPYRVQGREYAIGAYTIVADTVVYLLEDNSRDVYVAPRGVPHSPTWATIQSTYTLAGNIPAYNDGTATDYYIGDINVDATLGAWNPSSGGSSSAQGFADRYYAGGDATLTQRGFLQGGNLGNGSSAGSSCLSLWVGLGYAWWDFAAGD